MQTAAAAANTTKSLGCRISLLRRPHPSSTQHACGGRPRLVTFTTVAAAADAFRP